MYCARGQQLICVLYSRTIYYVSVIMYLVAGTVWQFKIRWWDNNLKVKCTVPCMMLRVL